MFAFTSFKVTVKIDGVTPSGSKVVGLAINVELAILIAPTLILNTFEVPIFELVKSVTIKVLLLPAVTGAIDKLDKTPDEKAAEVPVIPAVPLKLTVFV